MLTLELVPFFKTTDCAELVEPTAVLPKARLVGERVTLEVVDPVPM